jgi:hypothetical protein
MGSSWAEYVTAGLFCVFVGFAGAANKGQNHARFEALNRYVMSNAHDAELPLAAAHCIMGA